MADQLLCGPDPAEAIEILEECGSFLLIRAAAGFAVVERRNGRIYPMTPGERESVSMTAEADEGCLPESEARRLFDKLGDSGDRLARTLR
jgi:hypothetical protein